jgi:hypothetical protein
VVSKQEGVKPVKKASKDDVQCQILRRCCITFLRLKLRNSFKYVTVNKGPRR